MKTTTAIIIALVVTLSWSLTLNPEHFKKGEVKGQAKFDSIFNTFWASGTDDEHAMAERILSKNPSLLAALKSGKVNRGQDKQLAKLFTEDDECRAAQIA